MGAGGGVGVAGCADGGIDRRGATAADEGQVAQPGTDVSELYLVYVMLDQVLVQVGQADAQAMVWMMPRQSVEMIPFL